MKELGEKGTSRTLENEPKEDTRCGAGLDSDSHTNQRRELLPMVGPIRRAGDRRPSDTTIGMDGDSSLKCTIRQYFELKERYGHNSQAGGAGVTQIEEGLKKEVLGDPGKC